MTGMSQCFQAFPRPKRGLSQCHSLIAPLFVGSILVLSVLIYTWFGKKARRLIKQWATENDLNIVEMECRWFRKGPFFRKSSKHDRVYHILVQDKEETRAAYVKCGGGLDRFTTE